MNPRLLDDAVVAALAECLRQCPHVIGAYLLGSAVEGRLRPESDVDLAVLPVSRRGISVEERLRLTADASQAAGRVVDVGILSLSSLVYAKEAVAHGRLIFTRDQAATDRFAMYALSMYAAFQEARREILEAYAA